MQLLLLWQILKQLIFLVIMSVLMSQQRTKIFDQIFDKVINMTCSVIGIFCIPQENPLLNLQSVVSLGHKLIFIIHKLT